MFKNNVFKPDVNTAKWFKAAGVRALKTVLRLLLLPLVLLLLWAK